MNLPASTRRVLLVGCGKAKRRESAPAADLYTGSLFVAARKHAQASGRPWYIVSALHGIVLPNEMIEPYEYSMDDLRRSSPCGQDAVATWAARCRATLMGVRDGRTLVDRWDAVVFLCGASYADQIRPWLEAWGARCEEPLRGLALGARLRWLKEHGHTPDVVSGAVSPLLGGSPGTPTDRGAALPRSDSATAA